MITVRMIDGMSNVTVEDELEFLTNFITNEGIVVQSGTDLQVQAQASPDLTVKVKAGNCYVQRDAYTNNSGGLKYWPVCDDADSNVTIPANNSGGTIRRIICMKVDTGASPDANATNVASLVVVSGTSGGGDPTIPSNHLPLARVIHTNADTSISSSDITDMRVEATLRTPTSGSGFSAYASAGTYSIPASTWTKLQLANEVYDLGNEYDPTTNYRFTAAVTGKYQITATAIMTALPSGKLLQIGIYKNGTIYRQAGSQSANNGFTFASINAIVDLAAGDYVEIFVFQDSAGALDISGGSAVTWAMGQRLA